MTIEQKTRLFNKYKCLWLFKGIIIFHRYAISILLLAYFGASFITHTNFYIDNFYEINEGGIIFLFMYLLSDAIIRDKCTWHYASIFGLLASSIMNIVFQDNYDELYLYNYSKIILGVFSFVAVTLMILDDSEDEIKLPEDVENK